MTLEVRVTGETYAIGMDGTDVASAVPLLYHGPRLALTTWFSSVAFDDVSVDEIPPATALETVQDHSNSDALLFPLVSPLVLPSTAREAIAGASAPAVEGFDMSSPLHVRTPRSSNDEVLQNYPTLEAIAAAKSRSKTDAGPLPKDPQ